MLHGMDQVGGIDMLLAATQKALSAGHPAKIGAAAQRRRNIEARSLVSATSDFGASLTRRWQKHLNGPQPRSYPWGAPACDEVGPCSQKRSREHT
jgi:hypothetical protein